MNTSRHTTAAFLFALILLGGLTLPFGSPAAQSTTTETSTSASEPEQPASAGYRRKPEAVAMIIDGLVVRPVSFVGTLIGGAVYVVTLPFSALGGNAGEAGEALVVKPAEYTFTRCLGCFNEWP